MKDYKIEIVTRSMNRKLYYLSQSTVQFPYKRIRLKNTTSDGYLYKILKRDVDYLINIDEDAFVYDNERLRGLLNHMIENNIDICGMSDGDLMSIRSCNPLVVNPFFNIIDVRKIKKSLTPKLIREFKNEFVTGKVLLEPYEPFFVWLNKNFNVLYLKAEKHNDGITTILNDHRNNEFLFHTWYSRLYDKDEFHTRRINSVIKECISSDSIKYEVTFKERILQKMESITWFYFWRKYYIIQGFIQKLKANI